MKGGMRSLAGRGRKIAQMKVLVLITLSLIFSINLISEISVFVVALSLSSVNYGDSLTIKVMYSGSGVLKIYDSRGYVVFAQTLDNPSKATLKTDTAYYGLLPDDYNNIKIQDESGNDVWGSSFYVLPMATPNPSLSVEGMVEIIPIVTPTPLFNVSIIKVPQVSLFAKIDNGRIIVTHTGGESIELENVKAIVNGEPALISPRTGTLSAGRSFTVYGVKLKHGNNELKIIYMPNGGILLSTSLFNPLPTPTPQPEEITPTPIKTPVKLSHLSQNITTYLLVLLVLLLLPMLIWAGKRRKGSTLREYNRKKAVEVVGNSRIGIKQDKELKSERSRLPYFSELNKYEFLQFIGEGGFAKVYKVKRKSDGQIVALKIPKLDEATGKSFLREVSVWQSLDHNNIVKLYDANVYPIPYLEMEYVGGVTLDGKVIRDLEQHPKPVDEEAAIKIIRGIAEGLKYAHSKGIVHRDLKPQNVLLSSDLTPKITDWGLAKLAVVSGMTFKGYSPLYAAPEQLDPETYGKPDERTDIYQLGAILYELLTGRTPYEGYSLAEVSGKITNPEIKPKSLYQFGLSKYDSVVMKCLEKRKENRFSSVEEFLRALDMVEEKTKLIDELKKSLNQQKESLKKSRSLEELIKNRRMVVELLGRLSVIYAEMGEKAELLNCLEDLKFYTVKHADELINAINMVEYMMKEGISIPEQFVDGLKNLVHRIEREFSMISSEYPEGLVLGVIITLFVL